MRTEFKVCDGFAAIHYVALLTIVHNKTEWILDEDREEKDMIDAMNGRRSKPELYIPFLDSFGQAMKGIRKWNQIKHQGDSVIDDLLTISDEAFIIVCIMNYAGRWKEQIAGVDIENLQVSPT